MKKILLSFVLILALLSGCSFQKKPPIPLCRVVTHVEVQWVRNDEPSHFTLTDMADIQPVLIYLRTLDPMGQPTIDPEDLDTDAWKIVIHRSDGSRRIYRQQGAEYLSRNSSPWTLIDSSKGSRLKALFTHKKGEDF